MEPSPCWAEDITPLTPWPVRVRPSRAMSGPMSSPESTGAMSTNRRPAKDSSPKLGPRDKV